MAIEFEEAGRQTAKAAVAQARVGLLVKNLPPLVAVLIESPLDHGIEHEIHHVVAERAADQKLDRDVVDPLRILARVSLVGAQPTIRNDVPHRTGRGFVALARVGRVGLDDVVELQVSLIERVGRSGEAHRAGAVALENRSPVRRLLAQAFARCAFLRHRLALPDG